MGNHFFNNSTNNFIQAQFVTLKNSFQIIQLNILTLNATSCGYKLISNLICTLTKTVNYDSKTSTFLYLFIYS